MLKNFFKILVPANKYLMFVAFTLFIMLFLYVIWLYIENNSLLLQILPDGNSNDKISIDPIRRWPSGVPQSLAVWGITLGTFVTLTKLGVNPRLRNLATLGAGCVSSTHVMIHSAIVNYVGFNRLIYSFAEYRKTGTWPSGDKINTYSEAEVLNHAAKALEQADHTKINSGITPVVEEVKKLLSEKGGGGSSSSNFVPNSNNGNSNISSNIMDYILDHFSNFFIPSPVSGYLDDLIGQQIVILFVILFASISLLLLVLAYFINNLLLLNKDYLIKHLGKNKLVIFYLKYQVISIKISLFLLPLFIILGLITLIQSSYYLITHPIPYEMLDVNLHVYIKKN